jgi:hypothetical protein
MWRVAMRALLTPFTRAEPRSVPHEAFDDIGFIEHPRYGNDLH